MNHNLDICDWSQLAFEESAKTRKLYQDYIRSHSRKPNVSHKKCYKCFAPLRGKGIKVYSESGYVPYCEKCAEKL